MLGAELSKLYITFFIQKLSFLKLSQMSFMICSYKGVTQMQPQISACRKTNNTY